MSIPRSKQHDERITVTDAMATASWLGALLLAAAAYVLASAALSVAVTR